MICPFLIFNKTRLVEISIPCLVFGFDVAKCEDQNKSKT